MNNSETFYLKNRIKILYAAGTALLAAALTLGVCLGSTVITPSELFHSVTERSGVAWRIITYVRLPRTLASVICGGALAVAGAVIQSVLANRLASPSIIGVNAGAGLAVTLCCAAGVYGGMPTAAAAFAGAFISVMAVSFGSARFGASRGTVILIGVAVNSLLGALSDAIVTFIPDVGVMSNDFRVGEFSSVTYGKLVPAAILITVAFILILSLHRTLDVMTLGDDNAVGLGVNVSLMRTLFLLLSALLAGCAVSVAGLLSFVGLIVPHVVRRLAGSRSVSVISLSAIFGGAFVSLCDTASRTIFSPYEIPVGIIMAFIGAPFFIFLLVRRMGGGSDA